MAGVGHGEAGVALRAIEAPPPVYPAKAAREHLTGTVALEILRGSDGRPVKVDVVETSGHRELDRRPAHGSCPLEV
ncbi:MAG: energy transducer TonB [Pseudomonadota bacterium]|nr:energy transducer TonB [Pseudomonadota bacterium]